MFNIKIQTFTLFFFSVLLAKIFYLTLCQRNLYFLCLFFVLCVSAIFLHAPLTNIWKDNSSQFSFKVLSFFNSLIREIQNSESVGLFGKDLKSSFFLGHIYVVPFVELHTFSFLFFNLLINHFSLSTLNSHGVNYILRKPIVPQPLASTL